MVPRTMKHGEKATKKHEWSYGAPTVWGDIYQNCNHNEQSPVNFDVPNFFVGDEIKRTALMDFVDYKPLKERKVVNHGHNVQVNGEFGILTLPDGEYEVKQFHFHFPSEHAVNGQHAAGEIHIVHQRRNATGTNGLAVIGILLQESWALDGYNAKERQKELDFMSALGFGKDLPAEGKEIDVSKDVDLNAFSHELAGAYFHYHGSLTTPPCSETVHWYVLQRPAVVTAEMIASFKKKYPPPSNNRPVQKLNGREALFSELAFPGEFEKKQLVEAEQAHANAEEKVEKKEKKAAQAASKAVAAEAKEVLQEAKVAVGSAEHTVAKSAQAVAEAAGDKSDAKDAKEKAAEIKTDLKKDKKELKKVAKVSEKAQDKAADAKKSVAKADKKVDKLEDKVEAAKDKVEDAATTSPKSS